MKNFLLIASLACLLAAPSLARAQALPTATARGFLQAGVGYTVAEPDYGQFKIEGITGYADFDFTPHLGLEFDAHIVSLNTPTDLAEDSYVVGPRYVIRKRRFAPYAKLVFGEGNLIIQETQDNPGRYSGSYFIYGIGGGLDIDVTQHIVVRAIDFEYQEWPGLGNGLTPSVVTFGAAYRFR